MLTLWRVLRGRLPWHGRVSWASPPAPPRQRDDLWHGPDVQLERDVRRRLERLDPVHDLFRALGLQQELLARRTDAHDILLLDIVGGKARLGVLQRVLLDERVARVERQVHGNILGVKAGRRVGRGR